MKVITIRGVEPILSEKLKQAAKEKGESVNQIIIEMLKENFGLQKKKNILFCIMILIIFLANGLKRNLIISRVKLTVKEK